ncbi:T9SS type A sorting domain-containing protein [Adhaeribacter radiodurans]|uniref:T9SS type A sorting domain-containing protein n=1 Tax=Adhaeribacter radiodurans TaxID=2745197 RepID=A0A7L7L8Q2_9BACT|nr:T9SS type A sorting domain-containing protein [Adhaeribacter radiodurans]QMU28779.1 T9SS type A sorting domain-containing protein [Adhaeribacter radiodurans]
MSNRSGDKTEDNKGGYYRGDYWIIKLSPDGNKEWDRTIGGNSDDELTSLEQTSDGGYILGGTSSSSVSGDKTQASKGYDDYWVVKLNNKGRQGQDITFAPTIFLNRAVGDAPFELSATASSGLPVTFKIISGPAKIKGNIVTVAGVGTVTIRAFQAGNETYNPSEATQSFEVEEKKLVKVQWDKTWGGYNPDVATAIVNTADGGYLVGGYSGSGKTADKSSSGQGSRDFWLVKIDSQGAKVWDKTYGGNNADSLTAILATTDGGYLLGGFSASGKSCDKSQASQGSTDYWLVKIDENGQKLWDQTYGGSAADNLTTVLSTPDGGYLLGGNSRSGKSGDKSQASQGKSDYWLIKVDGAGKKLWDRSYGGSEADKLASLVVAPEGGYLVGGASASGKSGDKSQSSRGIEDYWIISLKEDGTKLWDKTYGGIKETYEHEDCGAFEDPDDCHFQAGSSVLTSLLVTPDGGYLLGGYSSAEKGAEKTDSNLNYGLNSGLNDYWVIKIDGKGTKVWDKIYGGILAGGFFSGFTGNSKLKSIISTPEGNYLLAGTSDSYKGGEKSENTRGQDILYPAEGGGYQEIFLPEDYWLVKIDGEGTKLWDRTIGSRESDFLVGAVPTQDGGYVLAGSSMGSIGGDKTETSLDTTFLYDSRKRDYWVVKVKEDLPLTAQWNLRYGGSGNEGFTTIIKTSDGGYLSGGYSASRVSGDKTQSSQGKNDYWLVKSDQNGKKLWDKRYGGSGDDYLNRIIPTKDGGYLLAGSSLSGKSGDKSEVSRGDRDYWIIKVDKAGTKQWDKSYGGSGYDELKKVLQLSTGEYILAGYSNSPVSGDKTQDSQGGNDYWLVKTSSSGKKLWDQRYGGSLDEVLGGIVQTADGEFLLGGSSWSGKNGNKTEASLGKSDFWLVQVDKEGKQLWDKTYGGTGQDEAYSVGKAGSTYFLAGQSDSPAGFDKTRDSQGGLDYWLLKVSSTGEKVWDKRYGGEKDDELRASIPTQDGGYLLAGKSFSNRSGNKRQDSQGSSDYWIVKADKDGQYEWSKTLGGSGAEELRAVIQTSEGGYLLGGKSDSGVSGDRTQPSQGGTDYWLVKVAPEATSIVAEREAIVRTEPVIEPELSPLRVYPNPAKDQVSIRFTLPQTQVATVKVYDSQGKERATLFQGEAIANQNNKIHWQTSRQPAGMYLLRLNSVNKSHTAKLLIAH